MDHLQFKKSLCVIPCYNEEVNLPLLFKEISNSELTTHCDLLFVNDASKDNTSAILNKNGYLCVDHPVNLGYGGAVKTGFKYALENNYEFFVLFPGDAQRKAVDAITLLKIVHSNQYDIAVGSKFHVYSEKYGPIRRRIGNQIFSKLAKYGWKSQVEDVLSGFKAYRTNSIKSFVLDLPNGYPFDIVLSMIASQKGLQFKEIDVACRYDKHTTKMTSVLFVCFKMLLAIIYQFFRFLFKKYFPKVSLLNKSIQ